ncbi:golgin-45 isoform X1 [Mustela putorius furo]|uniref:Golgin-45 isoform X1 n=1 Tax=Mustela putorius furo TaxID=9669 RepID=A0A8U0NV03_MUSPF|nr:golgin-45 isoform X1 [Mustela putorius furo]XP_012913816.1 golgin-45 isoform X1 [Mustela putorius furo]XP_012913817.1 golgin-45 isoform X1 [Mustela putorius furo]XP_012913818.1 golgin-45 isoform X1 [Mustela putorius furo]XP_044943694.1 golgin-45 isoform X1 [Mustela putorius furo]XP_044943696.1 golgin-45 isoform X1 [Mustela putorius furo]
MTTLEGLEAKVTLTPAPVRGAGDGMETEETPKSVEVTSGVPPVRHHILQNPRKKAVPGESPGVLQLGKILTEKAMEVEAIRILVPKAAITHDIPSKNAKVKSRGHPRGELLGQSEGTVEPRKELSEVKNLLEKLKNSERRLLQDKEGLSNQLRVQTEVNRELKKLLVASVGDDLQYHFERLAREKNQLILENEALGQNTAQLSEQLERMSIQCDVWRSKFLASRVMADELTNSRAGLQRQNRDAQSAIQDLLSEREQFRQEMIATQKSLEELLVSLQWGREQTYYPRTQPYTTAELALTNHKLAKAVNAHLLGNVGTNSQKKILSTVEFCSTPAEKMAETTEPVLPPSGLSTPSQCVGSFSRIVTASPLVKVLRILDPVTCTESSPDNPFSESSPTALLATKKNIGRFHPYTRYENITFNCCNHCQGELIVL